MGNIKIRAERIADAINPSTVKSAIDLAQALSSRGTSQEIRDPELLAAVVYRWVAKNISYDVASLDPTSRKPQDPDKVLKSGKAVCEGYACLSEFLLNQNHVEARIVHGLSRTGDSSMGRKLSMPADGHAWLVVKWDGEWHILEPTWGAGSVNNGRFNAGFRWDWFDCDPAVAIYSHLPEDADLQLLEEPLGQAEVEQAASVNFGFFKALDVAPQPLINGVISQGSGAQVIGWKVRPGFRIAAEAISDKDSGRDRFSADVFSAPSGLDELRFPGLPAGTYLLRVFAGKSDDKELGQWCGSFILQQTSPSDAKRLPTTSPAYSDLNAQLLTPLQADLASGQWQRFAIKAAPGLTLALKFENESTVHYLSESGGIYENRLLLRTGKLILWQVDNTSGKMDGLIEFQVK